MGRRCYQHQMSGGQGQHPAMHRTTPLTKNYVAQNVDSTQVEKLHFIPPPYYVPAHYFWSGKCNLIDSQAHMFCSALLTLFASSVNPTHSKSEVQYTRGLSAFRCSVSQEMRDCFWVSYQLLALTQYSPSLSFLYLLPARATLDCKSMHPACLDVI